MVTIANALCPELNYKAGKLMCKVWVQTQMYILTRLLSCWYVYQSYLCLHGSCCCWAKASQTCMFYSTILRPVEMCGGCLEKWGISKCTEGVQVPPMSDTPLPASKVGYPL